MRAPLSPTTTFVLANHAEDDAVLLHVGNDSARFDYRSMSNHATRSKVDADNEHPLDSIHNY